VSPEVVTAGIQALKREPATRRRFQSSDSGHAGTAHAATAHAAHGHAANARASANIAQWRSYLPEDCVIAMISAGWHWST
jgi:hypothetical protein